VVIPFTPSLIKYGVLAAAILLLCASSYIAGRKHVRASWEKERAENAATAARADVENRRTENLWLTQLNKAEAANAREMRAVKSSSADALQRLRDSAVLGSGVSADTSGAGSGSQCATRAELLAAGEAVVGLVERADTARLAVSACLAAWPVMGEAK
jgi:hypothetical protein